MWKSLPEKERNNYMKSRKLPSTLQLSLWFGCIPPRGAEMDLELIWSKLDCWWIQCKVDKEDGNYTLAAQIDKYVGLIGIVVSRQEIEQQVENAVLKFSDFEGSPVYSLGGSESIIYKVQKVSGVRWNATAKLREIEIQTHMSVPGGM